MVTEDSRRTNRTSKAGDGVLHTPGPLLPAREKVLDAIGARVFHGTMSAFFTPYLAVLGLDRSRKHITMGLPIDPRTMDMFLPVYRDRIQAAIVSLGLESWEVQAMEVQAMGEPKGGHR